MADNNKLVTQEVLAYYNTKAQKWTKAEDAKVLTEAKGYADSLADNYDAAGTATTKANEALESAKAYTDEQVAAEKERAEGVESGLTERITAIEETLGDGEGSVTEQIATKKEEAVTESKEYTDAQVSAEEERATAAEAANKALAEAAQTAADNAQADVDNLAELVGALPEDSTATDVIGYVDEQVAVEKARAEAAEKAIDAKADANAEDIDTIEGNVGSVDELTTTNKTVVGAINEVLQAVGTGGTAAVVTMTTDTTTEGALKSYTLKQGDTTIGTIDIPKDMVVESGSVVTLAEGDVEGYAAGTYIKLVLANVTEPLYINVGTLVDIYKAAGNAAQVQIAIDSTTREISATIVAGSITATELADSAVTTVKIADANVTKAKLSTEVQASLDKADAAATQTALEEEIARAQDAEAQALTDAKAYADTLNTAMDTRVKAVEGTSHTHENKEVLDGITAEKVAAWDAAEANAKAYADGEIDKVEVTVSANAEAIAANTAAIEANDGELADHETRLAAAEAIIANLATTADIDAMFSSEA